MIWSKVKLPATGNLILAGNEVTPLAYSMVDSGGENSCEENFLFLFFVTVGVCGWEGGLGMQHAGVLVEECQDVLI